MNPDMKKPRCLVFVEYAPRPNVRNVARQTEV
jgi:hypothetical protein